MQVKRFITWHLNFRTRLLLIMKMCYIVSMNWTNIIDEIIQRGYTMADIARHVGVEPVTIRALKHGRNSQPRWPTGDKILALHKKMMRKYPRIDDVA